MSTFQVECHTCQFGFMVERHVPHFQMIMLRASGLPVFKRCQEMGTEPGFCRNTQCLHRLTWKVLPQTSPQIVCVGALFFPPSILTHNLSWIFSTHHSLLQRLVLHSAFGLCFSSDEIQRLTAISITFWLDIGRCTRGSVSSALFLSRETPAWAPPSSVKSVNCD